MTIDQLCQTLNKVCISTQVNEKFLQEDHALRKMFSLQTCSKCKGVQYISREAQLDSWKYHKKVCCPIEKDDPRCRQMLGSFQECLNIITSILSNPSANLKGRLLLHAIKCMKWFLTDPEHATPKKVDMYEKMLAQFIMRSFRQLQMQCLYNGTFKIIFTIPGFSNFLFSEEVLMTPAMIRKKEAGEDPPPQEHYTVAKDGSVQVSPVYDRAMKLPEMYCEFIAIFLQGATQDHHESDSTLPSPLAVACCKSIFQWFASPWVHICYPAVVETRGNSNKKKGKNNKLSWSLRHGHFHQTFPIAVRMMSLNGAPGAFPIAMEYEVIPGMTAKSLLQTVMADEALLLAAERNEISDL